MNISFPSKEELFVTAEILDLCFSYLSPIDIKETRLVCKPFCLFSRRYLSKTVITGCQERTVKRFEQISEDKFFRNHFTSIIYAACPLPRSYASVDEYYESLRASTEGMLNSRARIPTKEQCVPYWCSYQELYEDQINFKQSGNEKTRIIDALRRMQNVQHLELSGNGWELPSHPLKSTWESGDQVIITPDSGGDGPLQISHGFEVMVTAFAALQRWPKSLVHTIGSKTSDVLILSCFTGDARMIFPALHQVGLFFSDSNIKWVCEAESCIVLIEDLRCLALEVFVALEPEIRFTHLFTHTWPNLSHLELAMGLDYELFSAFCQRHGEGLRCLILRHALLFGGTWQKLSKLMRSCLRLTTVYLEDLAEDDMPDYVWELGHRLPEAEDYLRDGGDNPFENGVLLLTFVE